MRKHLAIFGIAALFGAASAAGQEVDALDYMVDDMIPMPPTRVVSLAGLNRIASPKGMTLQWINQAQRGDVRVVVDGEGVWHMAGSQTGPNNQYVSVDGFMHEVGDKYFIIEGTITIRNAPDAGRSCEARDTWLFEITQNRKYYRLRRFEWCDGLTDYIDIYF